MRGRWMDLMGIWGYEGYVGLRITCRGMRDCGDMRDGPPPRNHPGRAAVFGAAPQSKKGGKWERKTTSDPKKKNAYF